MATMQNKGRADRVQQPQGSINGVPVADNAPLSLNGRIVLDRSTVDRGALGLESSRAPKPSASVDGLIHTIEGEVIPRLLLAHQSILRDSVDEGSRTGDVTWSGTPLDQAADDDAVPVDPLRVTKADVSAFAELLITFDANVAKRFIDAQVSSGHAVPDLLLDLCAPAARELGSMWLRDECSFCDVTIGLSGLEQVILHCAGPAGSVRPSSSVDRSALLAPMPGNQHVFGLLIVKELFRRSGWTVRSPATSEWNAVLDAVRSTRYSVLGLSVGSANDLQACQSLVKACRNESLNPKMLVIVGGYGIQEANMSTRMLDADLIARDGREGLDQIERIVARMAPQRHYN
ncbi:MAG: B12-binding domain-containing protein [Hyphomicrobiales bacterium]